MINVIVDLLIDKNPHLKICGLPSNRRKKSIGNSSDRLDKNKKYLECPWPTILHKPNV